MKNAIATTLLITFVVVTVLCNIGLATYNHSFTRVLGSAIEPLDRIGNTALKALRLLGFTSYEGLYDIYYDPSGTNKMFIAVPSKLRTETSMHTQTTYDLQKIQADDFCGLTNITGHRGIKFNITNSTNLGTYYYLDDYGQQQQYLHAYLLVKRNLTYSELNKFLIELDIDNNVPNNIIYEIRSTGFVLP